MPNAHRIAVKPAQFFWGNEMTLDIEGVADGSMGGEKSLRGSSRFETIHSSFTLSNQQVRIFRTIVAPRLNQDIRHLTLSVGGTPKVYPLAVDERKHRVQVPATIRLRSKASQCAGAGLSNLQCATPDGFIGDFYAALGK